MGHKLAASLMATTGLMGLKSPWPCWGIVVPGGLIEFQAPSAIGGMAPVDFVMVRQCPAWQHGNASLRHIGWEVALYSHGGGELASMFASIDDIEPNKGATFAEACGLEPSRIEGSEDLLPIDDRAMALARRLVLGSIAELDGGMSSRTTCTGRRGSTLTSIPAHGLWKLTRPVQVDVRRNCLEFCRGGGRSPSVRTMVRGHWKRQPVGSGGNDRKWIHVEPYWRGPEEGAVAVRPHVVVEKA